MHIEERPTFQEAVELFKMAEDVGNDIANLMQESDTVQRATDLWESICALKERANGLLFNIVNE